MLRRRVDAATERKVPTISDVAKATGVSIATVSNVLNGRSARVGDGTRRKVLRCIERLKYRPQLVGRSLRTARRNLLAMIIVDESENYLLDPFPSNLVAGFTHAVNAANYATIVHGGRLRDFEEVVAIKTLGVDGYCFHISGDETARKKLLDRLADLHQPVVLTQETLHPRGRDICVVRQDDFDGGRQLADHLLARGVRRMVFVTPQLDWPALTARIYGLRSGVAEAGQDVSIEVVRAVDESFEAVYRAVDKHLQRNRRVDALLGANDQIAIASMRALQGNGLEVPRDVLVTGFNGFEFWKYATPILTTVHSPAREIGRIAAEALVHRLETGSFARPEHVLPVTLQVSSSTDSAADQTKLRSRKITGS